MIAALVASCGCCNIVSPVISMFIGFVGAVLALLCEELLIRLQIDDPVGAVSVHGPPGVWGALAVAFFAEPNCQSDLRGLFYGAGEAGWELLAVQLFGVISMAAARWNMSGPFFWLWPFPEALRFCEKAAAWKLSLRPCQPLSPTSALFSSTAPLAFVAAAPLGRRAS